MQAKSRELDELNKELRQCNLQQFIQQAGGPAPQLSVPADDAELAYLMPDGQSDEGKLNKTIIPDLNYT